MKRILRIGAVVLLAAAATAACGGDDDDNSDDASTDQTPAVVTTAAGNGSTANGSASKITLVASEIKFDKASLTAKAGQPVTITLQNNDSVEHNITIEDLDVDEDAEPNESATSDAVTPNAGTYDYFCEYHPSAMKGQLIVS